jgi:hypothetical protein
LMKHVSFEPPPETHVSALRIALLQTQSAPHATSSGPHTVSDWRQLQTLLPESNVPTSMLGSIGTQGPAASTVPVPSSAACAVLSATELSTTEPSLADELSAPREASGFGVTSGLLDELHPKHPKPRAP